MKRATAIAAMLFTFLFCIHFTGIDGYAAEGQVFDFNELTQEEEPSIGENDEGEAGTEPPEGESGLLPEENGAKLNAYAAAVTSLEESFFLLAADAVVTTLAELNAALSSGSAATVEIPNGVTITMTGSETVTIPAGKTLTINGTLDIKTTGASITGSIGFIAVKNEGTLIVADGGRLNASNSNANFTNNGVYNTGAMEISEGGYLLIDSRGGTSRGVTISDGGVLTVFGDVDIKNPYANSNSSYGIYLSGTYGNQPTLIIMDGEININNTGGIGIHSVPYSNPIEIYGGTINVLNDSFEENAGLTKGIELNTDLYFYGGVININNKGTNNINAVNNPTGNNNTFGIWNRDQQFVIAGGTVNIQNSDPELLSFFNDGPFALVMLIEDADAIDDSRIFHRSGHLVYGSYLECIDLATNQQITNYRLYITLPGVSGTFSPVTIDGLTYYPFKDGFVLRIFADGYQPYPYEENPMQDIVTEPKTTKTVYFNANTTPPPEKVKYNVIKHFGTYTIGKVDAASAVIDCEDHLKHLALIYKGKEVSRSEYSVSKGSTVIVMNEAYMASFPIGSHMFTAEFTDGTSEPFYLIIEAVVSEENLNRPATPIHGNVSQSQRTYDTGQPLFWFVLMIASIAGMLLIRVYYSKQLNAKL